MYISRRDDGSHNCATRMSAVESKRRRSALAFMAGAGIFIVGAIMIVAGGAAARGPDSFPPVTWGANSDSGGFSWWNGDGDAASHPRHEAAPTHAARYDDDDDDAPRRHKKARPSGSYRVSLSGAGNFAGFSQPVCVRLCDGSFFPLTNAGADATSQANACNSLCPDAPTEVYYRNGSEKIEDA